MKKAVLILVLSFSCIQVIKAQEAPFNLDVYREFISANEDISPAKLHDLYPSDIFSESVTSFQEQDVLYMNEVTSSYDLTDDEMGLLKKNGFAVTERLRFGSYFRQFQDVYKKDLPVFISTDAILHAVHLSYDELLKQVELRYLIPELKELLSKCQSNMAILDQNYGMDDAMIPMLRDVDVYFTVPLLLLGENVTPYYSENEKVIAQFLSLIDDEDMVSVVFFSQEVERKVDFSQFKPRGHYEVDEWESSDLPNYFRAMIWLGRSELYLDQPDIEMDMLMRETVQRQIIDAALVHEILAYEEIRQIYEGMEDIISFFVGDQDNVNLDRLDELFNTSGITSADQLLDETNFVTFLDTLRTQPDAGQQILSQVLAGNTDGTVASVPSAFMLFGQRFVIDSYVTGQVVYDRIEYSGGNPCRLLPSTLDIMFAMGNDASTQLLLPELHQWKYSDNLAGLRYLIDHYPVDFWESSLYNLWLYAIKSLNPDPKNDSIPEFMKTGAWGLEKLNTQLASWAELRHDNLLYAKQSYTSVNDCSHPAGYVEPNPEFFKRMKRMAMIAGEKFEGLSYLWEEENSMDVPDSPRMGWGDDHSLDDPTKYFNYMYAICDTLETIAEKELSGIELTDIECRFFDDVVFEGSAGSGGAFPYGWYAKLVYLDQELFNENLVVADYHTTPTTCSGSPLGWVAHAGTGSPDMMIAIAPLADGQLCAFMGPVASYHEYRTSNFLRLADSEWMATYLEQSRRPEWVNGYLADQAGHQNESSLKLFSDPQELEFALHNGISSLENAKSINEEIEVTIAPNPIYQSTIISIRIKEDMRNSDTRLMIYDIKGRLIKGLLDGSLPPGNYMTKWDRTDDAGSLVPEGMYFLRLDQGSSSITTKLLVVD